MTNIAIAGAGTIGSMHAESFRSLPGVRATWVVDPILDRANAVAAPLGARVAGDLDEALSDPAVDAVLVAVPTPFHRALTEQAAAAGKHVFCEKPLALTLDDARAMTAACERAGVRLMVGHVVRFFPEYARINKMLSEGAVGTVGVVRASRLNAYPYLGRSWYADYSQSGGPILDLMVHDLDTLRWYFGEVERVYARGLSDSSYSTKVDHALAIIRFASGEIAHVETSWAHTSFRTAIEIAGSDGIIRHSSEETATLRFEQTTPPETTVAGVQVPRSPLAESPYKTEMRHFTDRLADGAPFLTDGEEGTRSLALALAVRESVRTGRVISFDNGWPDLAGASAASPRSSGS